MRCVLQDRVLVFLLAIALIVSLGVLANPFPPHTLRTRSPGMGTENAAAFLDPVRRCLAKEDAQCARQTLNRIHDSHLRQSPDFLELDARTYGLQHEYPSALEAIKEALRKRPGAPQYLIVQGDLYQRSGDQKSAIRSFLQAQALEPRSPVPLYSIGMSFFILGYYYNDDHLYDRAIRHFQIALKADSGYSKAVFMLGVVYAIEARLQQAKQCFEKAIVLDPQNPYYLLHYGVLLARMGQEREALEKMQRAAKLDPDSALAHFDLGDLYAKIGRYQPARAELEAATRLDPRLATAYYRLGAVYQHLKLTGPAQRAYEKFQLIKQQQQKTNDAVEQTVSSPLQQEPPAPSAENQAHGNGASGK